MCFFRVLTLDESEERSLSIGDCVTGPERSEAWLKGDPLLLYPALGNSGDPQLWEIEDGLLLAPGILTYFAGDRKDPKIFGKVTKPVDVGQAIIVGTSQFAQDVRSGVNRFGRSGRYRSFGLMDIFSNSPTRIWPDSGEIERAGGVKSAASSSIRYQLCPWSADS